MLVNGFEEILPQCPVVGGYEEAGWIQCPMINQWARPQCSFRYNVYREPTVQCYRNSYEVPCPSQPTVVYNQYHRQYVPRQPIVPNLPCNQGQQWDYGSMCYNVDGQPCQYTNVVDLEDFMNNEKRKEKSRVAARCRRTKEMQIFSELTAALPAKKEEVEQLDKASVMRLAISYLRARDVISTLPETVTKHPELESPKGLEEVSSELSYMKALDGFVLVLSQQGDIVYCSENIADHLGVSQMEIMGQSVFEFSHPCDHDEIREALRANGTGRRELLLRLKCTLTSKGRNVHLKSASYKVIHVTGHMLATEDSNTKENNNNAVEDNKNDGEAKKVIKTGSLVAVGRPIPHPSNIEIPLDSKTFLTKHSLDMKFTYTDDALMKTLGFDPNEMIGCSLYDYHHAADSAALIHQFKSLFSKGQCETGQYRFLAKSGGYAWVQTQATVITDKQQKPISVVCINYVISGIECKDEVFAAHQVQHADLKPVVVPPVSANPQSSEPVDLPNGAIVGPIVHQEERPVPVTELIFSQIGDQEMNKGFYMYSKDEGFTMLKEEAELINLAPNAGDACISLDNSNFNMFDDFIFSDNYNDNYCSLLGDDLATGSPIDSLTDSLLLSSPEPQESDSSCEQSLITELSFDGVKSENDTEEGNTYIAAGDDLPVLESAVMWGALPDNVSMARPQPSEAQTTSQAPALQRLLVAPPTGPPPQDLVTNIYSDQGLIPSRTVSSWETGVKRVLKQEEEEPSAKRVKCSPSPATTSSTSTPSTSVLMNLLDIQQSSKQVSQQNPRLKPNYQLAVNTQKLQRQLNRNVPVSVMSVVHTVPNKQVMRNVAVVNPVVRKTIISNPMSPLSLNIGSPMYSLPPSPNTSNYSSPAMSPAQRDRVLSPYSTPQSLSPVGKFHQVYSPGSRLMSPVGVIQGDPYLTKMQPSPSLPLQPVDMLLDSNMSSDMWTDSDMLQEASDLLTAFDDVKLV